MTATVDLDIITEPLPVFAAILATPTPPPFTAADAVGPAYVMPPVDGDRVRVVLHEPQQRPTIHPDYREQYRRWMAEPVEMPAVPAWQVDLVAALAGLLFAAALVALIVAGVAW